MAENAVVKDPFTDAMVEAGAEVARKLAESGTPLMAALWMFDSEINEWRLLFTSPDGSALGPRKVDEGILAALEALGDKAAAVPFSVISLLDPTAELVTLVRIASRDRSGVGRIRISKNAINGHYIDDALIYRVA